jgi:hypothetical protein
MPSHGLFLRADTSVCPDQYDNSVQYRFKTPPRFLMATTAAARVPLRHVPRANRVLPAQNQGAGMKSRPRAGALWAGTRERPAKEIIATTVEGLGRLPRLPRDESLGLYRKPASGLSHAPLMRIRSATAFMGCHHIVRNRHRRCPRATAA